MIAKLIVELLAFQASISAKVLGTPLAERDYLIMQGRHAGIQMALDALKELQDAEDK